MMHCAGRWSLGVAAGIRSTLGVSAPGLLFRPRAGLNAGRTVRRVVAIGGELVVGQASTDPEPARAGRAGGAFGLGWRPVR